ncbi:hypothetical protein [Neisseria sp. CCUG12390]|uniref:hypothetical protein n=1 Tax=Neisseria sp. CCUG12390 TaxID=3392035 RepID=UPI003A100C59
MLKKILFLSACIVPLLGGCVFSGAVSNGLEDAENRRWAVDESLTDTLVAAGRPVQSVAGFENALLLAGQKRAYLVQPEGSDSDLTELRSILAQTDLAYLSVSPSNTIKQAEDDSHFAVLDRDGSSTLRVDFDFYKPEAALKKGEKAAMEKLGFHCRQYPENLKCSNTMTLKLQAVNLADRSKLQHTFRTPLPLKFYRYKAGRGRIARGVWKALIPLAFAVDIVTFPIQASVVDIKK